MKALIRNKGETVLETDGIDGIDWSTGEPLTNADWCGGAYKLAEGYVEPEVQTQSAVSEAPKTEQKTEQKTYVIDGREYTREQILRMLN